MVWTRTGSKMPQGMTPSIIRANKGGSASFFNLPVRILDQEYHGINGTATSIDYRFNASSGFNRITRKEVDNTFPAVPDQPQWKTDSDTTLYRVRHTSLEGDGTPSLAFPPIDAWQNMTAVYGMNRPALGTSRYLTFRVELALASDLSTIQGSALMTLRWTR